jgi:hypothetical protein
MIPQRGEGGAKVTIESTCQHCGRTIAQEGEGLTWAHVIGPGSRLIRCEPSETGKPYGLEATPTEGRPMSPAPALSDEEEGTR